MATLGSYAVWPRLSRDVRRADRKGRFPVRRRTEIWFRNFGYFWVLLVVGLVGVVLGEWLMLLLPAVMLVALWIWPPPPGWEQELPRIAAVRDRFRR